MDLSAPINELKRKAKLLRRESGMPHNQALDRIAKDEGYSSWSILIRKYQDQKPKPVQKLRRGYLIKSLPFDSDYRNEAIELANSTFEVVIRRIEPNNPQLTRKLWNAADYIDNHHLHDHMLPIDSEYALSLIEAVLVHYVINLAMKADNMASKNG
ncbi:hypothetical protein [Rhizobium sp. L1K21]|uniref:hypothetical protein n=1 Tax=Rhizobium sp. L1K21 TaxID=2954933 RepID=UPI002092686C|nr:hypothetical protein [Rhizobium sp. L1K21]MCO6186865.1 hypothetical protein [Rhizobium sp. L1K21]